MRRVFVIFLALLFPLNVLALSLSAGSPQAGGAMPHAGPSPAVLAGCHAADLSWGQPGGDIAPDELPAGADMHEPHELLDGTSRCRFPILPAGTIAARPAPVHEHPSYPPIKPPPRR